MTNSEFEKWRIKRVRELQEKVNKDGNAGKETHETYGKIRQIDGDEGILEEAFKAGQANERAKITDKAIPSISNAIAKAKKETATQIFAELDKIYITIQDEEVGLTQGLKFNKNYKALKAKWID